MKIRHLFFCILLLNVFSNTFAQSKNHNENDANAIYINGGTALLFYSFAGINYERLINRSDKGFFSKWYLNAELGRFNISSGVSFAPAPWYNGTFTALRFHGLTGHGDKYFELGLGMSYGWVTSIHNAEGRDSHKENYVFPNVTIGYRYQEKKGVVFRTGLGFPIGAYIGLGYGF